MGVKNRMQWEDQEYDKSPSPALLKYRVREPVSPPPSRRGLTLCVISAALALAPTCTFATKAARHASLQVLPSSSPSNSKAKTIWPTRDSPDNPFLAGEGEASTSSP
jgi:hypothetical protein